MNDPTTYDSLNHSQQPDDVFRNRIAAALRQLDAPESDADIAAALDAVQAEPLAEPVVQRILHQTRFRMAANHEPTQRESFRVESVSADAATCLKSRNGQISMVVACLGLLLAVGVALTQMGKSNYLAKNLDVESGHTGLGHLTSHGLIGATPSTNVGSGTDTLLAAKPDSAKPGQLLTTGPREKRRVTLPDGSVLSINELSKVEIVRRRRIKLLQGEVFVEVVPLASSPSRPKSADRFVVETARREVTALGTKFVVKAQGEATNVVVTQGKVAVSGFDQVVPAGQELIADLTGAHSAELRPAKRSAYVVEWVKDLMAAGAVIIPPSEHSGGTITVVDPQGQEMKLSLRKFHVDVHIEDGFARTTIDQTYFNHTWQQLEGTFRFPLPADASLSRLAMYVNGTLMEGGMVERNHGRNVFEQIRHTRRDPALLEWIDGSTFQIRVFPLEPRQEKRIILSYTQRLPRDYGKSVYRFPAGHNLDGVREWSTNIRVKQGFGSKWYSPSHLLTAHDDRGDLVIEGREEYAPLDRDLIVEIGEETKATAENRTVWSHYEQDGFRYLMLRHRPELSSKQVARTKPRHWIFLVENSADRNALLAETQRRIVKVLLENSEHSDTFSMLRAGTQPDAFAPKGVECSLENVAASLQFLNEVAPIGALDLGQALKGVQQQMISSRETWIVHLGTGIPVLGERNLTTLQRMLPTDARYVGVAVGKRWSKSFMETAAQRTGGHTVQINPDEGVSWRAFDLLSTLNAPRLTDIAVTAKSNGSKAGVNQPLFHLLTNNLAHGQELAGVARYAIDEPFPANVVLTGKVNGQPYSEAITPWPSFHPELENRWQDFLSAIEETQKGVTTAGHLPRTWARLEIDRLIGLGAEEHKAEITELSKRMYVMSPFTSLLVLETEAMYAQFNVDRGRKDHWAMYPAPAQIPIVADNGPANLSPLEAAKERLKQAEGRAKVAQSSYDRSVAEQRPATDLQRFKRLVSAEQVEVTRIANEIRRIEAANAAEVDPVRVAWNSVITRKEYWQLYAHHYRNHWGFTRRHRTDWFGKPSDVSGRGLMFNKGFYQERSELTGRNDLILLNVIDFDTDGKADWEELKRILPTPELLTSKLYTVDAATVYRRPVLRRMQHSNRNGISDAGALDGQFVRDLVTGAATSDSNYLLHSGFVVSGPRAGSDFGVYFGDDLGANVDDVMSFGLESERHLHSIGADFRSGTMTLARIPQGMRFTQFVRSQYFDDYSFTAATGDVADWSSNLGWAIPSLRWDDGEWKKRSRVGELPTGISSQNIDGFGLNFVAWNQTPPGGGIVGNLVMTGGSTLLGNGTRTLNISRNGADEAIIGLSGTFDYYLDDDIQYFPVVHNLQRARSLPGYAPGLQSWSADRLAIVASVLPQKPENGEVDDEARNLIDKARSIGWQSIQLISKQQNGDEGKTLVADGAGRFVLHREVSEGLKETTIHDGTTMWHLYPEIALGAQRKTSRFHQPTIQSLIPWHVPAADDLAVGADVKVIGPRTIQITPRPVDNLPQGNDVPSVKTDKPADKATVRRLAIELAFAESDELNESRIVDLASKKVLRKLTITSDATVRLYDADDQLISERQYLRRPVEAPGLVPDTTNLVVLPLPYRSTSGVQVTVPVNLQTNAPDFAALSDDDALKLLGTYFAEGRGEELATFIDQRYTARGDHRIGFAVLMASVAPNKPLVTNLTKQHPDSALASFVEQFAKLVHEGSIDRTISISNHASPFLKRLSGINNHLAVWATDNGSSRNRSIREFEENLASTLQFARECRTLESATYLIDAVKASLKRTERLDAKAARKLADTVAAIAKHHDFPEFGRHDRINWLMLIGHEKAIAQATEFLEQEFADAIDAGCPLFLEVDTRAAFVKHFKTPTNQPCEQWGSLVLEAAHTLQEEGRRIELIAVARRCLGLNESGLAAAVFRLAIDDQDLATKPELNIFALQYAKEANDWKLAEECVQRALADRELAKVSKLWRGAAEIARRREKFVEWIEFLDKAYQMEFADLPKAVNLEAFRQDYGKLFEQFELRTAQLMDAANQEKLAFAIILQKAAARWREIDVNDTDVCFRTARMLTKLGLPTAAWNYWTTPLAETPDQSAAWQVFASAMVGEERFLAADRAWSTAFECEPTNPELLIQHAQFLQTIKQESRARELLNRIVSESWQPRFDATKQRAQELLREQKRP
ncbi:MAG: VIT domain-containing protein [Planctomycetota bacterium]